MLRVKTRGHNTTESVWSAQTGVEFVRLVFADACIATDWYAYATNRADGFSERSWRQVERPSWRPRSGDLRRMFDWNEAGKKTPPRFSKLYASAEPLGGA